MRATGLRALLGLQWRTHRRGTLVWMFALIATLVGTAAAVAGLYTTPEKIHTYAQAVTAGNALVAINGKVEGIDSLGIGVDLLGGGVEAGDRRRRSDQGGYEREHPDERAAAVCPPLETE